MDVEGRVGRNVGPTVSLIRREQKYRGRSVSVPLIDADSGVRGEAIMDEKSHLLMNDRGRESPMEREQKTVEPGFGLAFDQRMAKHLDTSKDPLVNTPLENRRGDQPLRIDVDMFPPVVDELSMYTNDTVKLWLTPLHTLRAQIPATFAFSTSLFPSDPGYEGFKDKFHAKILPGIRSLMKKLVPGKEELVLWTTPDIAKKEPFAPTVTIQVMNATSQPGNFKTLWRFLAMNDDNYDYVAVFDADQDVTFAQNWKRRLVSDKSTPPQWAIARKKSDRGDQFSPSCMNYATIIASMILIRPEFVNLDLKEAISQFVELRNVRAANSKPRSTANGELNTTFNKPCGEHVYGWGQTIDKRCFDETFLTRVVYYHFANQGRLVSMSCQTGRRSTWGPLLVEADLAYVRARGNFVVNEGCFR